MRTKVVEILTAIMLGIMVPSLLIAMLQDRGANNEKIESPSESSGTVQFSERLIAVLLDDGSVANMSIEEYVLSVVLSEMPANFELEALKAQAVVARTYALRRANGKEKHENAAICTDSSCCQGYCSIKAYLLKGGQDESIKKVSEAVNSTSGLVLMYDNKLIDATYFSCSGGATEDAEDVWGTAVPYLQSVDSPGEEGAAHYVDTVRYSIAEFLDRLGLKDVDGNKIKIGKVVHTVGGGVEVLDICNKQFTGTQVRKLLKLRSTAFYISAVGNTVTITTKGFGHRVGMSQYGADAMAVQGATFDEILAHYYIGTELIHYNPD